MAAAVDETGARAVQDDVGGVGHDLLCAARCRSTWPMTPTRSSISICRCRRSPPRRPARIRAWCRSTLQIPAQRRRPIPAPRWPTVAMRRPQGRASTRAPSDAPPGTSDTDGSVVRAPLPIARMSPRLCPTPPCSRCWLRARSDSRYRRRGHLLRLGRRH